MRRGLSILAVALLASAGASVPLHAQNSVEGRVTRLESELRAVQRRVFPGGTGQYLQPEIAPPRDPDTLSGAPSSSAVVDLTARVAALEGQIAGLTGQVEQAGFRSRQAQEAFEAYRRATDTRLRALEGGAPPTGTGTGTGIDTLGDEPAPPVTRPTPRSTTGPTPTPRATVVARPAPAPATTRPPAADPARTARVAVIDRPDTGSEIEDAYTYGFRLWQAKFYPEAEAQLKRAAAAGPTNRRYSFAQNLLGRAYLDDGKPSLASMAFYDNYKKAPDGERAPESLYYLAQALMKLNKAGDACKVYDELGDVYAARLTARQKADIASGRTAARCRPAG